MKDFKIYKVGRFTVTRIFETSSTGGTPQFLFPDWDFSVIQEHASWLIPGNMNENYQQLIRSIHTWVVQDDEHTILIDTGVGNDKDRPFTPHFHHLQLPYLERLKAVGITPEDVDYVLMTHLHLDHVGWNTRLVDNKWVPTFPNAKYVFPEADQIFLSNLDHNDATNSADIKVYEDSVLPIIEAGMANMVTPNGSDFIPGIVFHSTPGHTIGHMAISLTSQGKNALFGGDVMHHPLQVYRPTWNSAFCQYQKQARASRLWALEYAAENHAIFFSGHFAETSAGFINRKDDHFQWKFE